MSRPRKPADRLHNIRLDLWLTPAQHEQLLALAESRDIPKGVVGREALIVGLTEYLESLEPDGSLQAGQAA